MVTINLTLIIELGLFLTFMWAMAKYVYRPLLQLMDARDERLESDRETTERESGAAKTLEHQYTKQVSNMRRIASDEINVQHRKAQAEHNIRVAAYQAETQEAIQQLREDAQEQFNAERTKFPALTTDLDKRIANQLGLEEEVS
jgi:F-type H+-transporting ATPase subunit b